MAQTLAPKDIEKSLSDIRDSLTVAEDQVSFGVGASGNVIIISCDRNAGAIFQEYLEAFTSTGPSRFLFIELKDVTEPIFEVNAVCHRIGKSEHVCSEIISIQTPLSYLPKLASVIRAHILPGFATELFIADEKSLEVVFSSISQIPDIVYLDSLHFKNGVLAIAEVQKKVSKVIDLNWLRIASWREATRIGFDAIRNEVKLDQISQITISAGQVSSACFLLAGWFLDRLSPLRVPIKFNQIKDNQNQPISSIQIDFLDAKHAVSIVNHDEHHLQITAQIATMHGDRTFSAKHIKFEETSFGLLKRLLQIGESQKNFASSLRYAVELAGSS